MKAWDWSLLFVIFALIGFILLLSLAERPTNYGEGAYSIYPQYFTVPESILAFSSLIFLSIGTIFLVEANKQDKKTGETSKFFLALDDYAEYNRKMQEPILPNS